MAGFFKEIKSMTTNIPYPVSKHEYVIAPVGTNVAQNALKFNKNEFLRNKKIVGLSFHSNSYLTKDPDGNTLVPTAQSMAFCFLTLKTTKGVEVINKMPLYLLTPGVTASGTYEKMYPIDCLEIDWENSYITQSGATLTAGHVFMLSVFWKDDSTCPTNK